MFAEYTQTSTSACKEELCSLTTCNQRMSTRLTLMALVFSLMAVLPRVAGWSYHHSYQRMTWDSARAWCRTHYTDMVAIQNHEEIRHLNATMPFVQGYYWIGLRKVNGNWTWVGTNKTLTPEAENWATGEPNNREKRTKTGKGNMEDCVEIYIQRQIDSAKWNDIPCTKQKTALCYTASCDENSCSGHGECVETINNHTCECFKGFFGEKCEKETFCSRQVPDPHSHIYWKYNHDSKRPIDTYKLNETLNYSCRWGYTKIAESVTCKVDGWNPKQLCVVQPVDTSCPTPDIENGFVMEQGRDMAGFYCNAGFKLDPPVLMSLCIGDVWSLIPECIGLKSCTAPGAADHVTYPPLNVFTAPPAAMECPTEPDAPRGGSVNCSHPIAPHSFTSTCEFSCDEGFVLQGAHRIQCGPTGQWTHPAPTCTGSCCHRAWARAPPWRNG